MAPVDPESTQETAEWGSVEGYGGVPLHLRSLAGPGLLCRKAACADPTEL